MDWERHKLWDLDAQKPFQPETVNKCNFLDKSELAASLVSQSEAEWRQR